MQGITALGTTMSALEVIFRHNSSHVQRYLHNNIGTAFVKWLPCLMALSPQAGHLASLEFSFPAKWERSWVIVRIKWN